jgi:pyridoxal phosphate enzyme (YggS family)
MSIFQTISEIRQDITQAALKSGRTADDILLLAVTKTVPVAKIEEALRCGITAIGENKAQELMEKQAVLGQRCEYHFIGQLQANKIKYLINRASLIHSVDGVKLAEEINRLSFKNNRVSDILLEINIGGEFSKAGIEPLKVSEILKEISVFPNIKVRGLMTIPPFSNDLLKTRDFFKRMYNIFVDIGEKKLDNIDMCFLSMGMSYDYVEAIEEGANIVRIGSKIFGQR